MVPSRAASVNTQVARDAGFADPRDLIGKTDLDMPWKVEAVLYREDDRAVMDSGVPKLDYEEPLTNADGSLTWLSASKVPLLAEGGVVVGLLGIYHDVTLRRRTDQALREALAEKESLLKEIHHRVKNNLQVITSFLRLDAGRSQEPAVRLVLAEMQGRVVSMSVLHETLYRTGTFGRVDLVGYLKELAQQFFRAHAPAAPSARLSLDLSPVEVGIDKGIPCGLILHELISNSFKHAFVEGREGELRVVLRQQENGEILLQVNDTGPGLPPDFETRRVHSLGMQLVSDLARQIGGRLDIGPGPGARFEIRFASGTGEQARPGKR